MMFDFLKDIGNYESRKVARTEPEENNGIGVSTAFTSDEGYETALLDSSGVIPVENYKTKAAARNGHKKWVKFAKTGNGKKVIKLFWSEYPDKQKEVTLKSIRPVEITSFYGGRKS